MSFQTEIADHSPPDQFAQVFICALMNGAVPSAASASAIAAFPELFQPKGPVRTWKPRNDPRLSTPRLTESEWLPLRAFILRRDGYRCTYCEDTEAAMCVDHIVPLSRGGSNDPDNLTACCIPCNSSKSDRLLSEWKGRYGCR